MSGAMARPVQNVRSDKRAHGHLARSDAVHSPDHHADGDGMGHQHEGGYGKVVVLAGNGRLPGGRVGNLFPAGLHPAFRHAGLDGFQPVDHFHQQGVFLHVLFVVLFHRPFRARLEKQPQPGEQGNREQRKHDYGAGDEGHKQQKEEHEREIDAGQQSGGTEKFPQRFKFPQVVDQPPVDSGLSSMRMASTLPTSMLDSTTSALRPAMSTKRPRR